MDPDQRPEAGGSRSPDPEARSLEQEDPQAAARLDRILHSPSYVRAYEDVDFLMWHDLRPVRLQLELQKAELVSLPVVAVVLLLLSVASVWIFLSALVDPTHRYQRRVVAVYLGLSTLLLAFGVALLVGPGVRNPTIETTAAPRQPS